jgi:uncharacterized protein (TIGR00369 family)
MIGEGVVEFAVEPQVQFERSQGIVHGGAVPIIGQLANTAALISAFPALLPTSLDITIQYLRPLFVAQPSSVRARVVHASRRVLMADAEIWNAAGKIVARIHETVARQADHPTPHPPLN